MNPRPSADQDLRFFQRLPKMAMILSLATAFSISALPGHAQTDADVHIIPSPSYNPPENRPAAPLTDRTPGGSRIKPMISNVDLVLVPLTVTDPANKAVLGLEKNNFELYEDGRQQEIRTVYSEDSPLTLGVIFDTSRSMTNKIETARQSVVEFFKIANPKDDFFIITFSDRPKLLVDFTTSVDDIQNRMVYAIPQGHTSLLDAIYMGLAKVSNSRYARRALLVISDGGDNRSRYTSSEIKRTVQEADVQLYGIGLFDTIFQTPEERVGRQLLNSITEATGGRTLAIRDVHDLPAAASQIATELRNQYVIGYRSSNPARDGKWRKIKVKILPREGMPPLHVYAKSGYYSAVQ
jgi:Ca-activated chloride channel family protein